MSPDVDDLRAILHAYKRVVDASWPDMHPGMASRASDWGTASAAALEAELAQYVKEASLPAIKVRLFWKVGPEFTFGGCNTQFAQDAGFTRPDEVVGINDFDKRLPWRPQAAKYRLDDEAIVESKAAQLDIIERQKSPTGDISWVRVGKVPIQRPDATVVGVLGMYEVMDAAVARGLHGQQVPLSRRSSPKTD